MVKRIILLSRQSMFGQGIESLLSQETGFEIVSEDIDLNHIADCMQRVRPDVVIVNCDDPEIELTPAVASMLRERLGVCLIGLSLKDNRISIYRGQNKQVLQVEDLLEVIRE